MDNTNKYRNLLLKKKQELVSIGTSYTQNDPHITSDNTSEVNELAQVIATNNVISLIEIRKNKEIKIIDQLLAKIDEGDYGCCADCSNEIGDKRLQANPLASLCIDCQESKEHYKKTHQRRAS